MTARAAAAIIGAGDAALWLLVAGLMLGSGADATTAGLDRAAALAITALFAATGLPALLLVWRNRAPRAALVLALLFPAAFALLFAAATVAFMR